MKNGRPQAKDWPDADVLLAIAKLRTSNDRGGWHWVMRWDLADATGMPEKVCLAKMAALARKGLIRCCACGCRGDIELEPEGEDLLPATKLDR